MIYVYQHQLLLPVLAQQQQHKHTQVEAQAEAQFVAPDQLKFHEMTTQDGVISKATSNCGEGVQDKNETGMKIEEITIEEESEEQENVILLTNKEHALSMLTQSHLIDQLYWVHISLVTLHGF